MFADKLAIACSIITPDTTINLNDHVSYALSAQSTREQVSVSYNQQKASSPVLAGEYLVHSVPGMFSEPVQVWIFGSTQTILNSNIRALRAAFESWSYQLAWTWADYTEHWNCIAVPSFSTDQGHTLLHSYMASATLQVPRYPTVQIP